MEGFGLPRFVSHKGKTFEVVQGFKDWCTRCGAYLLHAGYGEVGTAGGATMAGCSTCGLVHEQR